MIAGGMRDDPAGQLAIGQGEDRVTGTTELEGPDALEVLAFEEDPDPATFIESS